LERKLQHRTAQLTEFKLIAEKYEQLMNQRRENDTIINDLERARTAANQQNRELRHELKIMQEQLYSDQTRARMDSLAAQREIDELTHAKDELALECSQMSRDLTEAGSQIAEISRNAVRSQAEANEQWRAQARELRKQIKQLNDDIAILRQENAAKEASARREIHDQRAKRDAAKARFRERRERFRELESQLQSELCAVKADRDRLHSENVALHTELARFNRSRQHISPLQSSKLHHSENKPTERRERRGAGDRETGSGEAEVLADGSPRRTDNDDELTQPSIEELQAYNERLAAELEDLRQEYRRLCATAQADADGLSPPVAKKVESNRPNGFPEEEEEEEE
jgi:chromosome segregation ATPase